MRRLSLTARELDWFRRIEELRQRLQVPIDSHPHRRPALRRRRAGRLAQLQTRLDAVLQAIRDLRGLHGKRLTFDPTSNDLLVD